MIGTIAATVASAGASALPALLQGSGNDNPPLGYLSGSDVMKAWPLGAKLAYQAEAAAGRLKAYNAAMGYGAGDVGFVVDQAAAIGSGASQNLNPAGRGGTSDNVWYIIGLAGLSLAALVVFVKIVA